MYIGIYSIYISVIGGETKGKYVGMERSKKTSSLQKICNSALKINMCEIQIAMSSCIFEKNRFSSWYDMVFVRYVRYGL